MTRKLYIKKAVKTEQGTLNTFPQWLVHTNFILSCFSESPWYPFSESAQVLDPWGSALPLWKTEPGFFLGALLKVLIQDEVHFDPTYLMQVVSLSVCIRKLN